MDNFHKMLSISYGLMLCNGHQDKGLCLPVFAHSWMDVYGLLNDWHCTKEVQYLLIDILADETVI